MSTTILHHWKPGMDLPYVTCLGKNRLLAISLPASWIKADRSGEPVLLPPAIRMIDRVRALFVRQQQMTPGFIISLRQGMGLTQEEFGKKLGVTKMTISRWECGRMVPSALASSAIHALQAKAGAEGIIIHGDKGRQAKVRH